MTWLATLHGDTAELGEEAAAKAEQAVRAALASIAGKLSGDGHTGIGATFHGDHTGDVNLVAPGDPIDAGPQTGEAPPGLEALPAGEVSPEQVAELAGVPVGTPVALPPGRALEPEIPDPAAQAGGDAETAPEGAGAPDTAPDTSGAS